MRFSPAEILLLQACTFWAALEVRALPFGSQGGSWPRRGVKSAVAGCTSRLAHQGNWKPASFVLCEACGNPGWRTQALTS